MSMMFIISLVLIAIAAINPAALVRGIINGVKYATEGSGRAMNREERRFSGIRHTVWHSSVRVSTRTTDRHHVTHDRIRKVAMAALLLPLLPIIGCNIVRDGSDTDMMVDKDHIRVINLDGADDVQSATRSQARDHYGVDFTKEFVIVDNAKGVKHDNEDIAAAERCGKGHDLIMSCAIAGHSGSMNKDGKYYAIPEVDPKLPKHAQFYDWALCGLKFSAIHKPLNKLLTYIGLVFSFAKPLGDLCCVELDIRTACVLDDKTVDILMKVTEVANDESTTVGKEHVDHRKYTDGKIIFRVFGVPAFQCRFAAILKGLAVYDAAPSLWTGVVTDIWGNEIDLSTKQIIIRKSAFKLGAPENGENNGGWFDSFDQFANNAVERGHRFYACRVYDHKARFAMSCYQDMQAVDLTDDEIRYFVDLSKSYMEQFRDINNVWKLLPGNIGSSVKRDPSMLNIPEIWEMANAAYKTKRLGLMNGRIPGIGSYIPVTVDERDVLHGDECYCSDIPEDVDEVDLARKPLIGPDGHRVMSVKHYYPNASKHVLFVAKDSLFWQAGNADIDGDTPEVIIDNVFVNAVKRTQKKLGCYPVLFPEGDAAVKEKTGRKAIQEYMTGKARHDDGSDGIGKAVNEASIMMAKGNFDLDRLAVLTYRANDGVNALSKHAATATVSAAENKTNTEYPWFMQFGHNKRPAEKCTIMEGVVNRYAMLCRDEIPEELVLNNPIDEMYDPYKIVGGKESFLSKWRPGVTVKWASVFMAQGTAAKNFEDSGLFYKLAFANAEEYKKMAADGKIISGWATDRGSQMRESVSYAIREINRDMLEDISMLDVMMIVWRTISNMKSNNRKSNLIRAFFTAFEKEFCILLDRYNESIAIDNLDCLCDEINAELANYDIGEDYVVEDETVVDAD